MSRETIRIVAIDQPRCSRTYGVGPCTAVLGTDGLYKCHNTRVTCQDPDNYDPSETVTLLFAAPQLDLAQHYGYVLPSLIEPMSTNPAAINVAAMDDGLSALGQRESVSVSLEDHLHSDHLVDKYRLERITGEASMVSTGTAQAGAAASLTLAADAPTALPSGAVLRLVSGAGSVQKREVTAYDGTTKIATVSPRWSTNMLQQSSQFDNAYWSSSSAVITANGTWWTINDDNAAAWELLTRNGTAAALATDYIASIKVKKTEALAYYPLLRITFTGGTAANHGVSINTQTGEVRNKDTAILANVGVVDDGDGWIMWVRGNSGDNPTINMQFYPAVGPTPIASGYNSATTGALDVKNIQLEQGTVLGEYIGTTSAAITLPGATTVYEVGDAYDPVVRGTFWGKWIARNPYYTNYALRVYEGYLGDALADMRVRRYIIDRVEGPNDGKIKIVAKDLFSKVEERKSVAPFPSRGELSAALTGTPATFSVLPTGIGDLTEEEGGYSEITNTVEGHVNIGDEIIRVTRVGDTFTVLERGALGTDAEDHDDEDLVQEVLSFSAALSHDITYTLFTEYSKIDAALIDKAEWDALSSTVVEQYTARIATPTPVSELVGELCVQAGFTVWPDLSTGLIKYAALRAGAVSPSVTDAAWIVDGSISTKRRTDKRVSQVWVYYGQKNPVDSLDDPRNFHSRLVVTDAASAGPQQHGTESVRKVFSRWIPQFGRASAQKCGERITAMFRDPPLEARFNVHASRNGQLDLARYFSLETAEVQDVTGLVAPTAMVLTRLARGLDEHEVEAQSLRFASSSDDGVRRIHIENDALNLDLRAIHDTQFPAPVGDEVIEFIIVRGITIGSSSTSTPAIRTGVWPTMVTRPLITFEDGVGAKGRVQGKGGRGGDGGNPGGAQNGQTGGDAILVESLFSIDNEFGEIYGGGGGGAGAAGYESGSGSKFFDVGGASGGGGAGTQVGPAGTPGPGYDLGGSHIPFAGPSGAAGSRDAGGAGNSYSGVNPSGAGGGPGLAGSGSSAASGGAAGKYVNGDANVNWVNVGDRRGAVS